MSLKVLGVLAGQDFPENETIDWARSADVLYTADSAADLVAKAGLSPTIVGDLDSVDPMLLSQCHRIVKDSDPDKTDCDKLLNTVTSDGHSALTLLGLEGDLLDHVLSSISSLAKSSLKVRLVLRRSFGYLLRPGDEVIVPDCFGKRVSLIPIVRSAGVSLTGVLWEVQDALMEPAGFLSVSNEGVGDVVAKISTGIALLFVEKIPGSQPYW